MNKLIQHSKYSREEVYALFNPPDEINSTWKQWGIVPLGKFIHEMKDDFIFYLTKGSEVRGHSFDEGITSEGVLSWQSQTQNSFKSPNIKKFIEHNESLNNIYFFYREKAKESYSFLGKLKYITHDKTRENPVYFQWQILNWDAKKSKDFVFKKHQKKGKNSGSKNSVLLKEAPLSKKGLGVTTVEFRGRKNINYYKQEKANKKLGLLGELLIKEYEIKYLEDNKRFDLAKKVNHVSQTLGDGLGYDILSFTLLGEKKFVEVKTTKGPNSSSFFITPTELKRSVLEKEYYLYRVYDYCEENNSGGLYVKKGPIGASFNLTPNEYMADIK